MPILATSPSTVVHPEIPYDKYLVELTLAPVVIANNIEGAMSLKLTPYRYLPDGTLDTNQAGVRYEGCGACYAQAETDPALAAAMAAILPAIQAFITARGY